MLRNQFLSQGCLIKIIRAKTFFTRSTLATFLRPTFDPKVKHQTSLSEPLLAADTTAASIIGGGSGGGLPACRLLQTFNETDIKGKRFDDNSAPGISEPYILLPDQVQIVGPVPIQKISSKFTLRWFKVFLIF